jgi:hypothetical protein
MIGSIPRLWLGVKLSPLALSIVAAGLTGGLAVAYYAGSERKTRSESQAAFREPVVAPRLDTANLVTVGENAYFKLEPGYRLRYRDGQAIRTMTVRRKTKLVDGVETRVVEEKEERDGQPTKVTWKCYAIDKTTHALYCFGVHVQSYTNGEVVSRRGWRSGVHRSVFTVAMPGTPKIGDVLVRRNAKMLYEVVGIGEKVVTPAGTFTNCLRTRAKEGGDSGATEKLFAPGVGLVKDGPFTLVKIAKTVPKNPPGVAAD